jgi:hypothetical protein
MRNLFLIYCICLPAIYCNGQNYLLANEKVIFSFTTLDNKKIILAKDTGDLYIVYRFGTMNKIEFEYPGEIKNAGQEHVSWKKFTYSYYFRGGGKQNEGLDLNYLYFVSGHYKFIIYDTYSSTDNKPDCGIKVLDLSNNKMSEMKGKNNSRKGTLTGFRDNNLVETSEELFD